MRKADDELKEFVVRGEYVMNGDDTFNAAKVKALEGALKILNRQSIEYVKSNARKAGIKLSAENVAEITKKILKIEMVKYKRELLTGDGLICRAEVKAKINALKLGDFLRNYDLYLLKRENRELKKLLAEKDRIIEEMQVK